MIKKLTQLRISVKVTDTDEELRSKAVCTLPEVIRQLGRQAGELAWQKMERRMRNSPVKPDQNERAKFISDTAREFQRDLKPDEKLNIAEDIFQQLRKSRDRQTI